METSGARGETAGSSGETLTPPRSRSGAGAYTAAGILIASPQPHNTATKIKRLAMLPSTCSWESFRPRFSKTNFLMATADRETAAVLVETDDSDEETLLLTHARPAAPNCTPAHAQEAKEQLTGCPAVLMAGEVKVPLNEYKDSAKDEAGNAGGKGPPMCALKDRNRACPWDTKYCKRWKFCTAAQEAKELREVEARAGAEMLFPLLETAVWEAHAELLRERAGGEREGADTERAEAPNCVPVDTVPTSPAVLAGTAM